MGLNRFSCTTCMNHSSEINAYRFSVHTYTGFIDKSANQTIEGLLSMNDSNATLRWEVPRYGIYSGFNRPKAA